jgi:hypothetical protein
MITNALPRDNQAAIGLTCECRDGAVDLAGVAHIEGAHFDPR